ncbi:hypothetical protein GHT06_014417 [Daphnia sinensis]|uniref:Uncharacterized protein n=1 Tax=Daphnia sinensis TaxID=1820382 RepID=A0AAD5PYV8_9CRUS|nr:hypothetical protein GHT06_014417 [Daphnia sinensis]
MKVIVIVVLLMIVVSGQAPIKETEAPNQQHNDSPTAAAFTPNHHGHDYKYNDAYHPEHKPPPIPRIFVFVAKIRKMFLV